MVDNIGNPTGHPAYTLLENTTMEHSERLVYFKKSESDEETWPDQQKDNDNDKNI